MGVKRDEWGMRESHVTVVIPCFNAEKFIGEAVESVFSQTHKDWDLIVIDDGSTDSSLQVVAELSASRAGQVQVLSGPNRGACHARNLGIQKAQGEFIALLDADDFWSSSKIEKQVQFLNKNPSVIGVTTGYLLWGSASSKETIFRDFHWTRRELSRWAMLGSSAPALNSTLLVRREALLNVGGFDEALVSFAEDLDLAWRLSDYGTVKSIGAVMTTVRLSDNQIHRDTVAMLAALTIFHNKIEALEPSLVRRARRNVSIYGALRGSMRGNRWAGSHLILKIILQHPVDFVRFVCSRYL